jgi:hypothetical protein
MEIGDIWFVGGTLAFFAICVAYVRGLDRIVRSAEEADVVHEAAVEEPVTPEAATAEAARS